MDNNVLRSPKFNDIIDDIIEAGFGKGATYKNPRTGKTVQRYVDFNQGLDALFLTEKKAKRLGEIALRPARIAFDHIEDIELYEYAMRLCAQNGITELSNYVLYNSEDFGGKGKTYHADTPKDLYDRMRITLNLVDDINRDIKSTEEKVAAFSFPMRYIPLSAHERGYVGSMWNAKFLRAVQRMLVPTQGKGVCSRSFFEADFGINSEEFERFLCMPEKLIASRGKISTSSRGKSKETTDEFIIRKANWERDQEKIKIWNQLFDELGESKESFIELIGDNEFLPEKVLGITEELHKKLYLLYLTTPRLFALLGQIHKNSPTYEVIRNFILEECPYLYQDLIDVLANSEAQQNYLYNNFVTFFGKKGIADLISRIGEDDFDVDKQMAKWAMISKKNGISFIDWELVRVYRRYVDLKVFNEVNHSEALGYITEMNMLELARILDEDFPTFKERLLSSFDSEQGQIILKNVSQSISNNIQMKLFDLLEGDING